MVATMIILYAWLSGTLTSLAAAVPAAVPQLDISSTLQNILANTDNSPSYTYPTDLTRGIKAIHSHNDYWRDLPFYTALSYGCVSVEADVWLYSDTLYVGHEASALTSTRTFDSLYVQPILDTIHRENPTSEFVNGNTKNGVFDTASSQTLYLWVDVKTNGEQTWPYVVEALQPLRDAGYLTTINGSTITPGPVTVIGTGNTPLDQVQPISERDYFWDAPIPTLSTTFANITATVSPIASTDFVPQFGTINGTAFNTTQLALLRQQIATAAAKGIKVRYWDTPAWPISTRNAIWSTLIEEGVGLLNADDLAGASGMADQGRYW